MKNYLNVKIVALYIFIFMFILSCKVFAESCSSVGEIGYKYTASNCDTITHSRTCCQNNQWSDWGGECSCQCADLEFKREGTLVKICQSCEWVNYGCYYADREWQIGDEVFLDSNSCVTQTCAEDGSLKPEKHYYYCQCQPGNSDNRYDNGKTYYGCRCYKDRYCNNEGKWGEWQSSAQVACKYTQYRLSKSDCVRYFGYSTEYDLDRYCGYFGGGYNCVNNYVQDYFNGAFDPLLVSCEPEYNGVQPYWWDNNNNTCWGFSASRIESQSFCESQCRSSINNY